jgi:predicted alpha/beta-fold hydrolase
MDVSSGLNTSFNIQSSYAGLEKAKSRALQLHPKDDPMMHIFMSITKKGDLQFKAKETGIKRLLQRFSIRSMSSEKVKMMEVLVTHIKITNSPGNVEKMMQLGKSISDIFNHIYEQRASSTTTLKKIVQADSFKEETQKVIKTLSADIMKASDIQTVLKKNYKELPKSIRHFDEEIVGKLFQLEEGENYRATAFFFSSL